MDEQFECAQLLLWSVFVMFEYASECGHVELCTIEYKGAVFESGVSFKFHGHKYGIN